MTSPRTRSSISTLRDQGQTARSLLRDFHKKHLYIFRFSFMQRSVTVFFFFSFKPLKSASMVSTIRTQNDLSDWQNGHGMQQGQVLTKVGTGGRDMDNILLKPLVKIKDGHLECVDMLYNTTVHVAPFIWHYINFSPFPPISDEPEFSDSQCLP